MSKNNHSRPRLIEFKLRAPENSNIRKARIDWLMAEILRLELSTLLLHGDTDYSVKAIPIEEQWRGIFEQDKKHVYGRIQAKLGDIGIVATRGNIQECLEKISRRFEDAETNHLNLSARQFSPFDMEYWAEKAKERANYWEDLRARRKG